MADEFDVAGGKFRAEFVGAKLLVGLGSTEESLRDFEGETIVIELKDDTTNIVADLIASLLNEHAVKVSIKSPSQ